MRTRTMHIAFLLIAMAALGGVAARAQAGAARSIAQTDLALSVYGAFSGTTTGNNVEQSPSNSAGGLLEVRRLANPILGFEATYAFNRANQVYNPTVVPASCPAPGPCGGLPAIVSANAHELTADWVPSLKIANLRPFAVLGGGLLLNVPSSGQTNTGAAYKPVYVYGGGLDWEMLPHLGLRLQYRGNLYTAPDLTKLYTSSGAFTHTAEPIVGVYFRR